MQSKFSDCLRKINQCRNQIITAAVVTIGSFSTGTVFGWSAVVASSLKTDFHEVTTENISWVISLAILGAFLGGPFGGFIMNYFGRRAAILIFSLPFFLGWGIMCSAYLLKPDGFYLLYIGRFITGMCVGCYLVVIPAYVKECSVDSMRGVLGSAVPLMLVAGILYAFIIGVFRNWIELSICCGIPPVCLSIGTIMLPETPHFLISKNKMDKAVAAYKWLTRTKDDNIARRELIQIFSTEESNTPNNKPKEKLFTRPVIIPIAIMVTVILFQQLGGVNAVTLYTKDIFQSTGDFIKPDRATITLGVVQVIFVVVSMFLVDVLGRRTLIVGSSFVMGVCLVLLGVYFHIMEKGKGDEKVIAWLPVVTIYTYIAAYSIGVGPIPWVLANEIYNPDYRAESATAMTSSYWIFGFIVAKTYDNLASTLHVSGSFWFYGAFCLFGSIFALIFVPETKGKSSDEILIYFGGQADHAQLNEYSASGITIIITPPDSDDKDNPLS